MPKVIKNVGLLMPMHASVCSTTPAAITEGALSYAQKHEHIRLDYISYSDLTAPLPMARLAKLNGIVFFISPVVPPWIEQLLQLKLPVVSTTPEPLPPAIARVHADVSPATGRVVAHFSEMKLQNAGVIAQKNVEIARVRKELFLASAREVKLNVFPFEVDRVPLRPDGTGVVTELNGAEPALVEYLKDLPKPAGIFTLYDILGVHVIHVAQQLGFRVPHEIAVVSAVDTAYCRTCHPQLSAMHAPYEKVGYESMALLERMMAGSPPPPQAIAIPIDELVVRGSSRLSAEMIDLEKARRFIVQNAHHGVTVGDVLDLVPISRPTFEKRFKARFGCTPGQEIRRARASYVKRILETTRLSITAIASMCSFSDVNKLNTFFKREAGTTPGKYRKLHHGNN